MEGSGMAPFCMPGVFGCAKSVVCNLQRMEGGAMNPKRFFKTGAADGPRIFPTRDQIKGELERRPQIHTEPSSASPASAARTVARSLHRLAAPLAVRQRRSDTSAILMRCSDRSLADIGIERRQIPLIARGINPRAPEAGQSALSRWWHGRRLRRDAIRLARRDRRRLHEELMAYEDRELDDIGIRRADITAVLRNRPPASAFE